MCFLPKKTPDFGPKIRLRVWGAPPPPLRKKFSKKGVTHLGGTPLYGQNPQSSICILLLTFTNFRAFWLKLLTRYELYETSKASAPDCLIYQTLCIACHNNFHLNVRYRPSHPHPPQMTFTRILLEGTFWTRISGKANIFSL